MGPLILTVDVLSHVWFVTLPALLIWTTVFFATTRHVESRPRAFLNCLPPFLVPLGIIACGSIFAGTALDFPQTLIFILLFGNIPFAGFLGVWYALKRKNVVPAVIASSVLATYFSVAAAFISSCCVSGDWL